MNTILPIYVLGNGDLYAQYFNAIVTSFGASNYNTLIRLSTILGGFIVLLSFVLKRNILDLLRWFGLVYITIYILFLPKLSVEIIDVVNDNRSYAVDHVPLGLAVLANLTTTLGYALTQVTEMNFSMPDDLRYHRSGLVFASELVRAVNQFEITDPRFDENIQGFIHQCVFYDILLKKYALNDLVAANDIWSLVSKNASPARSFIYTDKDNHSEITVCKDGVQSLSRDWGDAISNAKSLYASRLFPGSTDPQSALKKYLQLSFGYLTNLSTQADRIMQQTLMANAIQRGVMRMGSTLDAGAALQSYAYTRAQEQKRITNQTVGEMAATWLPLIKNAIELITFGSFVFVILLALLPFGPITLKSYIYTIIWLQLWPPLYAILNLTISFYAKSKSVAAVAGSFSLKSMPGLLQINADMAGLAGYLSMSIPALAGGLIWGMHHAFLQSSQYVGGVAQSTSGTAAMEAVTGNLGFGNTNFGNQSAFNTSANHADTSARLSSGATTLQLSDGSQLSVMPNSDAVINMGNTISNIGSSIGFSKAFRASYSQNADKALTAANSMNDAYHIATTSGMRDLYEIGSHIGNGASSGDTWSVSANAGTTQAFSEVAKMTQDFANREHISFNEAANVLSSVYADGKAGLTASAKASGSNFGTPLSGGVEGSLSGAIGGSRSAGHNNTTDQGALYSKARDFLKDSHYSENIDLISRAAQDKSLRIHNEAGNRLVENMGGSFDQAQGYRHEMQASLQRAESLRMQASKAEEEAVRIDTIGSQEFVEWVANKEGTDGKGKLGIDSLPHIMRDPQLRDHFLKEFAAHYKEKLEANWNHGLAHSEKDIQRIHQHDEKQIGQSNQITQAEKLYKEEIGRRAKASGLTQNGIIDFSVKKEAEKSIGEHAQTIYEKNNMIKHDGKIMEEKIQEEQLRKRHGSLLGDAWNNVDTKKYDENS